MNLKSHFKWMDRDWERRSYNPVFAFGQRLVWCVPILVIGFVGALFDAEAGNLLYDWGLPAGMALSMILMAISFYRWFKGYSRAGWQETQASNRRNADRR